MQQLFERTVYGSDDDTPKLASKSIRVKYTAGQLERIYDSGRQAIDYSKIDRLVIHVVRDQRPDQFNPNNPSTKAIIDEMKHVMMHTTLLKVNEMRQANGSDQFDGIKADALEALAPLFKEYGSIYSKLIYQNQTNHPQLGSSLPVAGFFRDSKFSSCNLPNKNYRIHLMPWQ